MTRDTQDLELDKEIREVARTRDFHVTARLNLEELAMLHVIQRKMKTSRSEAIRRSIRLVYAILSGAPQAEVANIIVQNPIVNMNINNNVAEAKPTINISIDFKALEELLEFLEWIAYQSAYPSAVKKRAMKHERTVRALLRDLSKLN